MSKMILLLLLAVGCKKNSGSDLNLVDPKVLNTTLQSKFHSGMFVPFSNVGFDPAFCAATSAVHAMVANRARFYPGKIPSQKCPKLWNQSDDAKYDQRVWALIEQEVLKQDFVGEQTLKIYGADNFFTYGTRNLQYFAPMIRRVQSTLGNAMNWKSIDKAKVISFNEIAEVNRKNNFMIMFVRVTDENLDKSYQTTFEALRGDCESRGYRWDQNTNRCDWSKQINEPMVPRTTSAPNAEVDFNSIPESELSVNYPSKPIEPKLGAPLNTPDIPKETLVNHAILVTGSYDDRTLEVYTTWTEELKRWRADLSIVYDGEPTWLVNPVPIETIPIKVLEDRSQAPDLLADLNNYYGYTGANAGPGCPGEKVALGSNMPVSANYEFFNFTVKVENRNNRRFLIIENIKGCTSPTISWSISKTSYDPTMRGAFSEVQTVASARWSSTNAIKSTSWPLDLDTNRAVVNGACGEQNYSVPFIGMPVDPGPK